MYDVSFRKALHHIFVSRPMQRQKNTDNELTIFCCFFFPYFHYIINILPGHTVTVLVEQLSRGFAPYRKIYK
jgi:hypothetical protein